MRRGPESRRFGRRLAAAALTTAAAAAVALPAGANAARPLEVGFTDVQFTGAGGNTFVKQAAEANSSTIRVNLSWRGITSGKPDDPDNPADPAYDWTGIDNAVRFAGANGVDVLLTTFWAPDFAEGANRPSTAIAPPGSWRPDVAAYGEFAQAVTRRYSGNFPDPANPGSRLPAVKYFEAWNEPNLSTYITPQYKGKTIISDDIYVDLLNAFYVGVKSIKPSAIVVTAGTAPFGDDPGQGKRNRPLNFWREVFCLNQKGKKGKNCGTEPKFDILAHHPINVTSAPQDPPNDPNDLVISNFGDLKNMLRDAEKAKTIATSGKHKLFANEVWWESNPPEKKAGIPQRKHAAYMAEAQYLLWKQGASAVYFLQLRDDKYVPANPSLVGYQTGIFTFQGKKKPAYQAVKFPFVTERKSAGRILAWGRSPATGTVTIEAKRGSKFKKVGSAKAKAGGTFKTNLKLSGKQQLRARVGGNTSLIWKQP